MRILSIMLLVSAFTLGGCDTFPKISSGSNTSTVQEQHQSNKPKPPPVITEFGDIPIPRELKRNDSQSFVYEAPSVVIGVMIYTGHVTANSVSDFFRQQMPTQGWRFMNAFKDENIALFFMKENRSCQISIKSGVLDTKVIIKVGPSS